MCCPGRRGDGTTTAVLASLPAIINLEKYFLGDRWALSPTVIKGV
jgi:hypothetical protein